MLSRKPMPDRFKKTGFARTSLVVVLLALLLNASAHIFVHLNDVPQAHHTVSSQDGTEPQNTASPFGSNDCLTCQSLQHLRLSNAVTLVSLTATDQALADWHTPLFSTYNPARAISDRAPPTC